MDIRRLLFYCLLFSAASAIRAADFPPAGFTEIRSQESSQGTFQIIYYRSEPDEILSESQIWLKAMKPNVTTQFLFRYQDDARCIMSPDERYIAVNNHVLDGWDELEILARNSNGIYRNIRKDLMRTSLKLMAKQLNLSAAPEFDFRHCTADAWLRDGLLLSHLQAHQPGVNSLDEWYFIYDVKNDRFSWNLSKINQGAFHLIKR